jgi:hypothetical protein
MASFYLNDSFIGYNKNILSLNILNAQLILDMQIEIIR